MFTSVQCLKMSESDYKLMQCIDIIINIYSYESTGIQTYKSCYTIYFYKNHALVLIYKEMLVVIICIGLIKCMAANDVKIKQNLLG